MLSLHCYLPYLTENQLPLLLVWLFRHHLVNYPRERLGRERAGERAGIETGKEARLTTIPRRAQ